MRFELWCRRTLFGKRWHWRLKAANNRIICSGDPSGYHNREDAKKAIELVRTHTGPMTEIRCL